MSSNYTPPGFSGDDYEAFEELPLCASPCVACGTWPSEAAQESVIVSGWPESELNQ